jgi:hypothetical protein
VYIGGLAFVNQSVTLIARGGSENPRLPRQPAYECLTLKNELQLYQLFISLIKKPVIHYSRKKIGLIQALSFFNEFSMLTKFNHHLLGVKLAQQNGIYSTELGFFFLFLQWLWLG